MKVEELAEHLQNMIEQGKGDFEVVHANMVGKELDVCGFEVVETGFFDAPDTTRGASTRTRSRLRLFTHSPF